MDLAGQRVTQLSADNSKLYEKLKFMEYKADPKFARYEDSSDPFRQFHQFVLLVLSRYALLI
jgi:hypothetical protein